MLTACIEKYQLEIVRCKGLTPLLRLLKSSFLPLILSSVACIRNISIHPANESPIIDEGFVNPLIQLLSYDDNEEIQCHAISTLRNLAASSERNKRAIVEAGAVERIKTLIDHVPAGVQTEMTAAIAVLALSDELKQRLLGMGVLEVLVPLTLSENLEVQGNSAAAIGNLSSKVRDYKPFVKVWNAPDGGLCKFLERFLDKDQDVAFQHIGVWTIEQFLEGGEPELVSRIAQSQDLVEAVTRIANTGGASKSRASRPTSVEITGGEKGEPNEDGEDDIYGLSRRVAAALQEVKREETKRER